MRRSATAPPEVAPKIHTEKKEGVVGETMGFPTSEGEPWFPYRIYFPARENPSTM